MSRYVIGLGGNQGDVAQHFKDALELITVRDVRVESVSSLYRTLAVGEHAGADFLNAIAVLETSLVPLDLLDVMQDIENDLGRVSDVHWGPRTIDLDIILNESTIIDHPRLSVPHPHAWYRRFVVDPLVEIAPQTVHPVQQLTFEQLQGALLQRPFTIGIAGLSANESADISEFVRIHFDQVEIVTPDNAFVVLSFNDQTSQTDYVAGDPANPKQSVTDLLNSALLHPTRCSND